MLLLGYKKGIHLSCKGVFITSWRRTLGDEFFCIDFYAHCIRRRTKDASTEEARILRPRHEI